MIVEFLEAEEIEITTPAWLGTKRRTTTKQVEHHLRMTRAFTIGDIERLAGVNTYNPAERAELWAPFVKAKGSLPGDAVWQAVRADLLKRTARAVNDGRLCLVAA